MFLYIVDAYIKMPFKSKSQLRTCYSNKLRDEANSKGSRNKSKSKWDCDEFLKDTKDPTCLPEKVGYKSRSPCRTMKKEEKVVSKLYMGARGGIYFYAGGVKVYVPKDVREFTLKKYGPPIRE